MCGIAGYYDKNTKLGNTALSAMAGTLSHRGPDAQGFFSSKNFHLCHSRLSIIDLRDVSNQPFISSCGRYVIVFNGEIYNFKELRAAYQLPCRTLSDTEVILELFIKMGPSHVTLLNGMFAYCILDTLEDELYLYRDRLGVKPLFYYYKDGFLAFGSEIKTLKQNIIVRDSITLNKQAIAEFLHLGYIPQPHTIYKEIHKFPAGHFARFKSGMELKSYWKLSESIRPLLIQDESAAETQLESLLHSSIKYRMIADVPIGVFLSGGVDSSMVAALAGQHHTKKIQSFTIGFKDGKYDESKHALKIAQHLGTEHHELIIEEKAVFEHLDNIFTIYDEPFADQSMLPSLAVCKLAAQHVKVVLTGDGGDEFFYGYGAYTWAQRLQNPVLKYNRKLLAKVLYTMPARYKRIAELLDYSEHAGAVSHIHAKENGYFSTKELQSILQEPNTVYLPPEHSYARALHNIERQALFDAEVYLKDDLLVKMDRASMHYSLEAREPLLDYRIVELALNLDISLKKRENTSKYLLKKILYKYVPQHLLDRPKWGFTIPLDTWLQNDLSYLKSDYLNKPLIETYGIVSFSKIQKLLKEYQSKPYKIQQIWAMILLHKWLKENY